MAEIGAGFSDYRAPSIFARYGQPIEDQRKADNALLGKLQSYKSSAQEFIRSQPALRDVERAFDILGENNVPKLPAGMSNVSVNLVKREFREMVAAMSNLRPMENCTTANDEMKDTVSKLNKRCKLWWNATFADRKYREAVQWTLGLGTGYIVPWWDNNFYGYGQGEIALKTYGPSSVLPLMLNYENDLQKAYCVTIVEPTPLHLVLAAFPDKADKLMANRRTPGWISRAVERAKQVNQDLWGILNTPMESPAAQMPEVDVYYSYIMDTTVNNTGRRVMFGEPGTNFNYTVPYVGEEIPSGTMDSAGRPQYAKATHDDAMNFPLRRLCIWTDTVVLRDDTSPYLHGRVPAVQLRFDDYPWDFLGYSIVHDTWRIQRSRNRLLRIMENAAHVRMRPPLTWDENMIDEAAVARINTMAPGQTIRINSGMGEPIKPLLPVQHWDIPSWIVEFVKLLAEDQSYLSLAKDLTALAKAKQIPSADSIEKLMESAGQVPQDMARGGEKAICELAALWFPMEIQFSSARNYVKVLGEVTKEALDYKPGSLIPSHLPDENKQIPSRYQDWQRLRWVVEQMSYQIEPYSQAAMSRIGRSLQLLQLQKAGLPISWWTILKAFNIDLGPPPKGTTNEIEVWVAQQKLVQEMQQAFAPPQQPEQRGRKPTNQTAPHVVQKDQGQRSTIATSK